MTPGVWAGLRQGDDVPDGLAEEPVGEGLGWDGLSCVGGTEDEEVEMLMSECLVLSLQN